VLLVFSAGVFLFMAAIAFVIKVDNFVGRLALFFVGMALIVLALYFLCALFSSFNRIEVGPERLKLRLGRTRGPGPLPSFIRASIPYDAIAAVETREEVYSTFGLVTVLRVYSIVTRDGARFPLGVMAENWGLQMPYDQAAKRVAARAQTSIRDKGTVRVGGIIYATVHDVPPWSTPTMTSAESVAVHRRAVLAVQIIGLLTVFVAVLRACSHA
jgi:hypothetical protein